MKRRKEVAFVEGRFHCEVDCEYPTQCRHTVYRAFKKGRAEHGEDGGGYVYWGDGVVRGGGYRIRLHRS